MGIIFWLSSQPQPFDLPEPLLQTLVSKGGHMIGYAGLSVLWGRALAARRAWPERRTLALAFLLAVLYAISDEVHQTFVPGRNGSPVDVLIDATGAVLGLWLLRRWQKAQTHP
jgi:VanZ family protein